MANLQGYATDFYVSFVIIAFHQANGALKAH